MSFEIVYPDYDNSILSITQSILNYYGITPDYPTLPVLNRWFDKKPQNVILMVLDGLGVNVLKQHLSPDSFLRRHFITDISTVFPPTTTYALRVPLIVMQHD